MVLPGAFLADIYGLYGARLLEQNVRVFLQARTKVNRGIVNTVRESPDMFFAYNNGLTAIASHIDTERLSDGTLGIRSVTNLQIVNGGQTTASILYAKDQNKADLSDIFVQMKLSVIEPEEVEEIVPRISRFANTQNRISEADFFSNHPSTSRSKSYRVGCQHLQNVEHWCRRSGSTSALAANTGTRPRMARRRNGVGLLPNSRGPKS